MFIFFSFFFFLGIKHRSHDILCYLNNMFQIVRQYIHSKQAKRKEKKGKEKKK
jgi:hypothetical protein